MIVVAYLSVVLIGTYEFSQLEGSWSTESSFIPNIPKGVIRGSGVHESLLISAGGLVQDGPQGGISKMG